MQNLWKISEIEKRDVIEITEKHGIHPIASMVLVNLGITVPSDIKNFLYPDPFTRLSPYSFKDMSKAVTRLRKAIELKEGIYIYCDKDVDGVTAGAILINLLQKFDVPVFYTLPVDDEPYGFSERMVREIKASVAKLLITEVCGIKENIYIKELM